MSANSFFIQATKDVKKLESKPDDKTLLLLYAYFKQAIVGDINTESPSFFDFKGVAKWNAWNKLKGMSTLSAQVKYIKLVTTLQSNQNINNLPFF